MASALDWINVIRAGLNRGPVTALPFASTVADDDKLCISAAALGSAVGASEDPREHGPAWVIRCATPSEAKRLGTTAGLPWSSDPPEVQLPEVLIDLEVSHHFELVVGDEEGNVRGWWLPGSDGSPYFLTPDAAPRFDRVGRPRRSTLGSTGASTACSGGHRPSVTVGSMSRMAGDAEHSRAAFRTAYQQLEAQMRTLAEADGDAFLPNPEPSGPAHYILIGMEPSLGRWARTPEEARDRVAGGFRNFVSSIEDFILHFCIRTYLCEGEERYHITDLSKGAMLIKDASVARRERYNRWYELLTEEVELVATADAAVFAIGADVAAHLTRRAFPRPVAPLIHYSGLAGRARAAGIRGHEDRFDEFRRSLALRDVLDVAEAVLTESVPPALRDEALTRLSKTTLTESRKKLAFNYRLAFEQHRLSRPAR